MGPAELRHGALRRHVRGVREERLHGVAVRALVLRLPGEGLRASIPLSVDKIGTPKKSSGRYIASKSVLLTLYGV